MGKKRDKDGNVIDDDGNIIATKEDDPPDDDDSGGNGPTAEEIFERWKKGELFTQEHYNEKMQERIARDREARKAEEAERNRKAAEDAKAQALKDQENFKELSETQATQIAEKDQTISSLKDENVRIQVLEDRLSAIVDAQLSGLDPAFKALLDAMTVEQKAEWIEAHPDKVNAQQGTPDGSPPTPPPGDRGRKREAQEDQEVRNENRYRPHSRI